MGATGIILAGAAQGSVAVAGAYISWHLQVAAGVPAMAGLVLVPALLVALGCAAGYFAVAAARAIGFADTVARHLLSGTSAPAALTVLLVVLFAWCAGFLHDDELCGEPEELAR